MRPFGASPRRKRRSAFLIFFLLASAGCGGPGEEGPGSGAPGSVEGAAGPMASPETRAATPGAPEAAAGAPTAFPELWTLAEPPLLEIGVVEGEEPYQLHQAQGSARLDDGRIVVANAGSREIRFFDQSGRFLMAVGRSGEGPGEFRFPARVRIAGRDSLLVWDRELQRVSYFDDDGGFLGSELTVPTADIPFPGDEWIEGRFWVDSPLAPAFREPIRRAIEVISLPEGNGGLVYLKVTRQGRIWASAVRPPADTAIDWSVFDLRGRPVARVRTPARFEPHDIGSDYVLGRFFGPLDVNFIRLYALRKPEGSERGEGLRPSGPGAGPARPRVATPRDEEALAPIKSLVKRLATLEELHYAEHYTYTTDTESLFSEADVRIPEGLEVNALFADAEGWMGVVRDRPSGRFCALAYGGNSPMGWTPGVLICP